MKLRRPARYLLIAIVAAIAVCELALRAAGFGYVPWYRPDPHLGWTLRPGASGWFTGEGRAYVRINSQGQRDREHALEKPAGVYRIAVLGDAYAEAMQVPLEHTYWAQLPAQLEGCGFQSGRRIEVLNFGVRDYGTAQSYLVLERTAIRYRPDLVLLQFDNGNDVRDNSRALDPIQDRPYFVLDASGGLRLDDAFAASRRYASRAAPEREWLRKLAERSRVLQLASSARRLDLLRSAHAKASGNEAGLEVAALAEPRDALWEDAWRVSEALVARIGEFAARHGARVAVVAVPFAMEVHPDAAWRARLQTKYGVADLAYPDRRIVAFARDHGMLGIMLAPPMKALAESTGAHLYGYENRALGFGHWNRQGHAAAAQIIARELCAHPSW